MRDVTNDELSSISGGMFPSAHFWGGVLETGGGAVGAYDGAVIGAEFGAIGGPIGGVVGAVAGFAAGYLAATTFGGE